MSHIFISYSRKDIDLAQKIVDSLAANNLDTWIDWKSIPKGEDWEQEIYRGVEEADAFLFLLSPDSVISEMCNKEIAHAVKNGKRILPIVIRDTDRKIIQPEINKRNWIFCREGQDDFSNAIEETRNTIHTDYEWLKYHTELQIKALQWEKKKDTSRLLRGKELQEAEEKLAKISGSADPQPNRVQREFILASRRHEDTQRRRLTLVLGTLVLFAFLAAFIALLQAKQAGANQLVAEARTSIGQQNYHLAGLLALEAENLSRDTGQGILASLPYMGPSIGTVIRSHDGIVSGLSWTLDNRLVSSSEDGTIKVWNMVTYDQDLVLGDTTSPYLSIAVSPNGLLASGNGNGIIELWNLSTGKIISEFYNNASPVLTLAWSHNGQLASGSEDGSVVIWKKDGGLFVEFHEQIDKITSVAWGTEDVLASTSLDGSVKIWNVTNHDRKDITSKQIGSPVKSFVWISDHVIAIGLENGKIILWDVLEAKQITLLDEHTGPVNSLAITNDGNLISGSGDGRVLIWNMETGRPQAVFHEYLQQSVTVVTPPLNGYVASGTDDGHIIVWDLETGQVMPTLKGHTDFVTTIAWSQNGRLASGSADGSIKIWNQGNWSLIQNLQGQFELPSYLKDSEFFSHIFLENGITTVAWSKDNILASGLDDGRVIVWSQQPDVPNILLNAHKTKVFRVAWSVDGQLASASEDGDMIVWDLIRRTPQAIFRFQDQDEYNFPLTDFAWSPDGKQIIAVKGGSVPPEFLEWDVFTGKSHKVDAMSFSLFRYRIKMIDWSTGGRMVAAIDDVLRSQEEYKYDENYKLIYIGTYADDILMWNNFPEQPYPMGDVHRKPPSAIAWSADGHRFATGSENGDVVIWYAEGGGPLLLPAAGLIPDSKGDYLRDETTGLPLYGKGHSGVVTSLAWSPDGQLASSSTDGTIIIWDENSKSPTIRLRNPGGAINSLAWSTNGQLSSGSSDGKVIIWDLQSKEPLLTFDSRPDVAKATNSDVMDIAWYHDDEIAASLKNGLVIVWDGKTYKQINPSAMRHGDDNQLDTVFSLAWSPDGHLTTAANTLYSNIILWDKNTWDKVIRIPGSTENGLSLGEMLYDITNVVWSTKGKLVTAEENGTIMVWDVGQQKPYLTFKSKDNQRDFNIEHGFHIAVSSDDRIASSGIKGYIEIWDVASGKRLKQLSEHQAGIKSMTWSPDERLTISYRNGQIIIWDKNLSHIETILQGHLSGVNEVAWSNDGHLASAGEDSFVRILPQSLTVPTCEWLARNFSQEEWEIYFSTRLLSGLGIDLVYVPGYRKTCPNLPSPDGAKLHFSISGSSLGWLIFIISLTILLLGITMFIFKRRSKSKRTLSSTKV